METPSRCEGQKRHFSEQGPLDEDAAADAAAGEQRLHALPAPARGTPGPPVRRCCVRGAVQRLSFVPASFH